VSRGRLRVRCTCSPTRTDQGFSWGRCSKEAGEAQFIVVGFLARGDVDCRAGVSLTDAIGEAAAVRALEAAHRRAKRGRAGASTSTWRVSRRARTASLRVLAGHAVGLHSGWWTPSAPRSAKPSVEPPPRPERGNVRSSPRPQPLHRTSTAIDTPAHSGRVSLGGRNLAVVQPVAMRHQ